MESNLLRQYNFTAWDQTIDFLEDERFLEAYRFGINSGHRYGDIALEWQFYIVCCLGVHARNLDGDFVECGVNTGRMSLTLCKYIDFNATGKRFFLFDTFCGMPEEQMSDRERPWALEYNANFYPDVYEIAKRNFAPFPKAQLIRGPVPDTLAQVQIEHICYLHIDMNIVAPEIAAIRHFWRALSPGAVVLLDDYNHERHIDQKRAMDAFAARMGTMVIPLPTAQGLIIKH